MTIFSSSSSSMNALPHDVTIENTSCHFIRLKIGRNSVDNKQARVLGVTHLLVAFEFIQIIPNGLNSDGKRQYTEKLVFAVWLQRNPITSGSDQALDTMATVAAEIPPAEVVYEAHLSPCGFIDYESYRKGAPSHGAYRLAWPYKDLVDTISLAPEHWPAVDTVKVIELLDMIYRIPGEVQPKYDIKLYNCWWYVSCILTLLDKTDLSLCVRYDTFGVGAGKVLVKKCEASWMDGIYARLSVTTTNGFCHWNTCSGIVEALRLWQTLTFGARSIDYVRHYWRIGGTLFGATILPQYKDTIALLMWRQDAIWSYLGDPATRNPMQDLAKFDNEIHELFWQRYNERQAQGLLPQIFDYLCSEWWSIPERTQEGLKRYESSIKEDRVVIPGYESLYKRRLDSLKKERFTRRRRLARGDDELKRLDEEWIWAGLPA